MSTVRHPSRAHLVAVTTVDDEVRGSGYLLGSRLVLTAGHVVTAVGGGEMRVCRMQTLRGASARVLRTEGDVALLLLAEELADPGELGDVEISTLAADARFEDCAALGLPAVMTRVAAGVTLLEPSFHIASNSAESHGYLSLELVGHPPEGAAPWSGMSGAPVFHAGRWLVGVVLRDSAGWGHARLEAAPLGAFFEAVPELDALFGVAQPVPRQELQQALRQVAPLVTESDARDAVFLDAYRREVVRRYGHIQLFGLGLRGLDDEIGIEHAYVSLRAGLPAPGWLSSGSTTPDQARPVEHLIPKNTRLLLRGDPGAGKSTLLEWLAVSMARGSCRGPLRSFNHRVPFLLRLRDMYAPRWKKVEGLDGIPPEPERFLDFNRMAVGFVPPDGWARRMLAQERALLLVDGLDEVLESHRDGVIDWISRLLRDHPQLHIIVTGRPEAVRDWPPPQRLGFAELKLLELNGPQRAELIRKWHEAAAVGVRSARFGDEERERRISRLTDLETALVRHIDGSGDLAVLAATPLLCAVLCKLHEVHGARLPRFRQELYARTINMMLGLRDEEREVPDPLPHLDVDQRRAILSWIAGYLTTEGEREITLQRFDEKVEERLRSLGRDADTYTAEEIREALRKRSGLLVAPSEDSLRFSHRTFQDYLAATDMVAKRAFGQLAGHAGDETWGDVLRFAMSQCNLADTGEFVAQFRRKLRLVTDRKLRTRMRLAAGQCIPYAVQMAERDRRTLASGVAKVFCAVAKRDFVSHVWLQQVAEAGPDLLSVLERDYNWDSGFLAVAGVNLAGVVGGPEAIRFLARIPGGQKRQALSHLLVQEWTNIPGAEYANEVLAGLRVSVLRIDAAEQLDYGQALGRVNTLMIRTAAPIDAVAAFADEHSVQALVLSAAPQGGASLAVLTTLSALSALAVGTTVLGAVSSYFEDPSFHELARSHNEVRCTTPALPNVIDLTLSAMPDNWSLGAAGWTRLTHLGLVGGAAACGMTELGDLPALTHLFVASAHEYAIPRQLAHPGVTHVGVVSVGESWELDLAHLSTAFPSLAELTVNASVDSRQIIDLTHLDSIPRLKVRLFGFEPGDDRLRGVDAFPVDRISWT
ncbi:NACHT domain-containing protein [Streptomyces phaeolivaceus]|uniref:NACHT domain-containing protein n=1 Tax=Streptomyces phaeolivaceus TaxID=2653200 RepID=A0A5P8K5D4_9ACTN|nr:NACHT domain-containing protein [Streptomyces phaeolivaceus]QFQ98220.1 NACHT domain-containing protein [Streptomyces phaeolivaceus]